CGSDRKRPLVTTAQEGRSMIRTPELVEALAGQIEPRFKLRRFDELKIGTERTYLVKGLIPRTGLAVVWGPPKCGKSFWTFDLVVHIALGREYRGRPVRQGTVVYCALEGGGGFGNRPEAWRRKRRANAGPQVPYSRSKTPLYR